MIYMLPWKKIGQMLRNLSLAGTWGNGIAIFLYAGFSMLPVVLYLVLRKKEKIKKADNILFGLTAFLFIFLYCMINPDLFRVGELSLDIILAGIFYSLLLTYLMLRGLEGYKNANKETLEMGLELLLVVCILFFGAVILEEFLLTLPEKMNQVKEGNTALSFLGTEQSALWMTNLFLVLEALMDALPYGMDMGIGILAIRMIRRLKAVQATKRLADWSLHTVMVSVVAALLFQLLELVFVNQLLSVHISIKIPLLSVLFGLTALLFSRYIQENQKLKQDNDLFI